MVANLTRVVVEARSLSIWILCFTSIQVPLERSLGVHDDVFPSGELHDKIRSKTAFLCLDSLLFNKVTVWQHLRDLDDSVKLNFTPAPPHDR